MSSISRARLESNAAGQTKAASAAGSTKAAATATATARKPKAKSKPKKVVESSSEEEYEEEIVVMIIQDGEECEAFVGSDDEYEYEVVEFEEFVDVEEEEISDEALFDRYNPQLAAAAATKRLVASTLLDDDPDHPDHPGAVDSPASRLIDYYVVSGISDSLQLDDRMCLHAPLPRPAPLTTAHLLSSDLISSHLISSRIVFRLAALHPVLLADEETLTLQSRYKPTLLDRYPRTNYKSAPLPPHVWMVCVPYPTHHRNRLFTERLNHNLQITVNHKLYVGSSAFRMEYV
jgi:hypothetical protein